MNMMKSVKKLIAVFSAIATASAGLCVPAAAADEADAGFIRLEAESMQINRARIMDAVNQKDSGGKHVEVYWEQSPPSFEDEEKVDNDSYIRTVLDAPSAGTYTLKLGYTAWGDVSGRIYVNDKRLDVTVPGGTQTEYEFSVELDEGKNAFIFSWINWAEIDYLLIPDTLSVYSDATDTYYPASSAALNMTWFNTLGSIYDPEADLYTGTLYLNVDDQGVAGEEQWQPSATFTMRAPETIKSLKIDYYIDTPGDPGSQISLLINGSDTPLTVSLDGEGPAYVSGESLIESGFVPGDTNTVKVKQTSRTGGSIGIYSLKELTEDEPALEGVTKTAKDLVADGNIRMLGRSLTTGDSQSMDWTGSGFAFVYEGKGTVRANVSVQNPSGLMIEVNGEVKEVKARKGYSSVTLAENLTEGKYTIKVYKVTEANGYLMQLNSLTYDSSAVLKAAVESGLKFEFIGDSITCGNQIDVETGEEDGYRAYASVLARAYKADWNTISCSGRGLMEGYNSESGWQASKDAQMKDVFDYVSYFRDSSAAYDYSYQPDVLVIGLGSNDLGSDIMGTLGTTIDQFVSEVTAFSVKMREKYPDTEILWCYGAYSNNGYADQYRSAVENLNDPATSFISLPQMVSGRDMHPNAVQHVRIAKILSGKISAILGVENPMSEDLHFEAEDGVITVNGTNASIKTESQLTAYSGNSYAADMNAQVLNPAYASFVTVPVTVSKAGYYRVTVSYGSSAEYDPTIAIRSNDYAWVIKTVPAAKYWDWIKTFDEEIYLRQGKNTVSITGAINGAWANIDCFELEYLRDGEEPGKAEQPTQPSGGNSETEQRETKNPETPAQNVTKPEKVSVGRTKVKSAVKKRSAKKIKISLKKTAGVKRYQVQVAASKKFKKVLYTRTVKKVKASISGKKLKNKKKLFVRARAFKTSSRKKYYGVWSKAKKVKIKK